MKRARIETFEDDCWITHSKHHDPDYAIINAETLFKSRNCKIRVIQNGKILFEREPEKYSILDQLKEIFTLQNIFKV